MRHALLLALVCALPACTSSSSSISPIQTVGCDVETLIISSESAAIASLLKCGNQAAIQGSLQSVIKGINLCNGAGVSAVTTAQVVSAKAKAVSQKAGLIGNIACPLAVGVLVGYASGAIPAAWSCSASASAAQLNTSLTAACEAAVPL